MAKDFFGGTVVPVGTLLGVLFLLTSWAVHAQDVLPEGIRAFVEQMAEQGSDAEELVRYYEGLQLRPLNINAASRAQIEQTGLLTLFQLESLLAWRERYGAVRSATELSLVEGFSPERVALLRPFFSFGDPAVQQRTTQEYTAKFRKKWQKPGFSVSSRGIYDAAGFSVGTVIDNDPQERFPDFLSVSARYKGLYAGDFTARFGQGLVLWKSFSLTAFGTPSSVSRRGGGLREYRGTGESNFFRGLGYTHTFGSLSATAFASYHPVDARVVDGRYTSISTDGLHATEAERARRHAMHEWVVGANVSWDRGRWHVGLTAVGYRYDKANGRRVQEYNRYQQYDGVWGNLGVDFYGSLGSLRLFGEAAVDAHAAPAALAGAVWSPSYNFETSLTLRCYAPAYIATHSGAWSTLSSVSNQLGALYALQWIRGRWTLRLNADFAYYPWKRYRAEAGTIGLKARMQLLRTFRGGAEMEAQVAWSSRIKGRLRVLVPLKEAWTFTFRADANPGGLGGFLDVRWKPSRKWDISTRMTAWSTKDWDSRISFYERDVPGSFPIGNYAGKGIGAYLVARYAPTRHVELWVKAGTDGCSYFVRIFIPG